MHFNNALTEEGGDTQDEQSVTTLISTWLWMGSPYYVFEQNGRRTMSGMDIRRTISRGVLSICNTPTLCGNNCLALTEWNYAIDVNQLTLTSRLILGVNFTYTRQ